MGTIPKRRKNIKYSIAFNNAITVCQNKTHCLGCTYEQKI
jgi:hypothetical protein